MNNLPIEIFVLQNGTSIQDVRNGGQGGRRFYGACSRLLLLRLSNIAVICRKIVCAARIECLRPGLRYLISGGCAHTRIIVDATRVAKVIPVVYEHEAIRTAASLLQSKHVIVRDNAGMVVCSTACVAGACRIDWIRIRVVGPMLRADRFMVDRVFFSSMVFVVVVAVVFVFFWSNSVGDELNSKSYKYIFLISKIKSIIPRFWNIFELYSP